MLSSGMTRIQVEARKRGRTLQVSNPYAAARTQEEVARRWEQLNEAGRARAKAQFQADKKAYAALTAGQKRSWAAPTNPEPKYKRHTPRRRSHAPNLLGLLGQAEATLGRPQGRNVGCLGRKSRFGARH